MRTTGKSKERRELERERQREKYGYAGYFALSEIFDFCAWSHEEKGFSHVVTEGNELAKLKRDGRELVIWYDEKLKRPVTSRWGMVLWYDWHIFYLDDMGGTR